MKKFISIVALVLLASMLMAMPTFAAEGEEVWTAPTKGVQIVYANDLNGKDAPVFDGIISEGEYGDRVVIVEEPYKMAELYPESSYVIDDESTRPAGGKIEYHFAYDETYIYVAFKEYGATYDDGNAAFKDFAARNNYGFGFGFDLNDMTNYISHSVTYGGGCWNGTNGGLAISEGKPNNFASIDEDPDQFYAELFVNKYPADEADLPDDERDTIAYGDILVAQNTNAKVPYIMEVEMKLDRQQVIEFFNEYAYTAYSRCPDAMWFLMTANTFRLGENNEEGSAGDTASAIKGNSRYMVSDIREFNEAQKTKFFMDYGRLPNSPVEFVPSLIVFAAEGEDIYLPAELEEEEWFEEEEETEYFEEETEESVADESAPVAETEADETEPAAGGCGGTVTFAGLALVAALGTCTAFVAKKKED